MSEYNMKRHLTEDEWKESIAWFGPLGDEYCISKTSYKLKPWWKRLLQWLKA